ncbi:hypothetical protein D9M68_755190 [compost metagenome]
MDHRARTPVYGQRAELQALRRFVRLAVPAQQRPDPRQQHARLDRLDDVIVRARFQAQDLVQVVVAGGEHQDGRRRKGAQVPADLQAVTPRQHQVQDGDGGVLAAERLHRLIPTIGLGDVEPVLLQELCNQAR